MAEVPYNRGVPDESPTAAPPDDYQHIQTNVDQFGGAIGRGLEKAGQGLTTASDKVFDYLEFQGKVNTDDQINKTITRWNGIMYGDPGKPQMGQDGQPVIGPDGKPQTDTGFMGMTGRSASDQRAAVLKRLEEERAAGEKNLASPKDKLAYNTQTRRMFADREREIGAHTDSQWKVWAGGVNNSGADIALRGIADNAYDEEKAAHHTKDLIDFRVQAAQIKYGNEPKVLEATIADAKQEALIARLNEINVKNPAQAAAMADKYKEILGTKHDDLANNYRARADWAVGRGIGDIARNGGLPTTPSELAGQILNGKVGQAPAAATPDVQGAAVQAAGAKPHPIAVAANMIGADENRQRQVISSFIGSVGGQRVDPAVTPWCAAFVNAALRESGLQGSGSLAARSFLNVGSPVFGDPKMGDVMVFSRGADQSKGHVAFYAGPGSRPDTVTVLGGNQDNKVSLIEMPRASLVGIRRMSPADVGKTPMADVATPQISKGDSYRRLLADPQYQSATPEQQAHARAHINQEITTEQIAADATAKQQKEASDASAKDYLTEYFNQLHNPSQADPVALAGRINADKTLEWRTQNELMRMVKSVSGEEQVLSFGPGYLGIKNRMLSPPGTADHIADVADIYRMPEDQLTVSGKHELVTMAAQLKKSPDQYGQQQSMAGLEKYAKSKLSFNDEMLIPGVSSSLAHDPHGEQLFNSQFVPQFHAAFGKWVAGGKDPFEFLTKDNVDKMISGMRSQREMAEAKMRATNALGEVQAPVPPPKGANVNTAEWAKLIEQPVALPDGTPLTHVVWANALNILATHPTQAGVDGFNRLFGRQDGADILKRLTGAAPGVKAVTPKQAADGDATNASIEELQGGAKRTEENLARIRQ